MSEPENHAAHNCVQSLFDTLIDVNEGYKELVKRAEPEVRDIIQDVADQHSRDLSEIEAVALKNGVAPDRSGTVMSEVHKTAVRLRDLFTDIDRHVLEAVGEGEENVVSAYDSAIKHLPASNDLHSVLVTQRRRLQGKIVALFEAA
ncbi:PA2169 family four-helix-bundle protein [Marivita geojedonensis]|uniref:DUF2383 domain-containing protein n=1 Tax=Marivita geojedonensis TaxID=1123756 RepID=A0A1X4ND27_9RHOB|nr:PA2169 family four-helix-bundle protein [Marivita geojedonensis]OSQ44577.1 hypothetical protein MGEO_19025 [Marivita geojedonensis]PRY73301.1 uncharacterized protein (TIGR02284 family) [Marivita geojedonensis]